jgi:site-specific recombinase XerD
MESFVLSLEAGNKSPRTIESYRESIRQFAGFLVLRADVTDVFEIRRDHVEAFVADLLQRFKPATANNRYRALQQFFRWALEEGEVESSPMALMRPPTVPEQPPTILTEVQLSALLRACEGTGFDERRDMAIVRLFLDSGMRRAELTKLGVDDVDLHLRVAVALGRGSRRRACPFGKRTAQALDRYVRVRALHREAARPELWLGLGGPMTDSGIAQVLRRRSRKAGIPQVHAHMFRHFYAHSWLANGGQEGDLMQLAGWRSRAMLARYGPGAAAQRAQDRYRERASPGDRL